MKDKESVFGLLVGLFGSTFIFGAIFNYIFK
ncbi:Uncharacterised protein [[Clostridium] sordellii]|nr:Uncharacterised protein [[Clostridium] sordellii] [Paeniclostridium sordellii]